MLWFIHEFLNMSWKFLWAAQFSWILNLLGGQVGDPWKSVSRSSIKGLTFLWTLNNKRTLRKEGNRQTYYVLYRVLWNLCHKKNSHLFTYPNRWQHRGSPRHCWRWWRWCLMVLNFRGWAKQRYPYGIRTSHHLKLQQRRLGGFIHESMFGSLKGLPNNISPNIN